MLNYLGWNASTAIDPHWSDVVLLVQPTQADGTTTFTDLSPSALTVTTYGNAQVDNAVQFFGKNSILLDGTGDLLSVPHSTSLTVANTTEKTMEAMIRINTGSRINTIMNKRDASSAEEFSFYVDASNKLVCVTFDAGATHILLQGTTTLSTATDYHVAWCRYTRGSTHYYQLFLNGAIEATANSVNVPSLNGSIFLVGRDGSNSARDFNGWIGGVRYTNACRYFTENGSIKVPVAPWPLR